MDMRIEAAPMAVTTEMVVSRVIAVKRAIAKAIVLISQRVASFSYLLSLGGHSISAVTPDYIRNGGTAVAV